MYNFYDFAKLIFLGSIFYYKFKRIVTCTVLNDLDVMPFPAADLMYATVYKVM